MSTTLFAACAEVMQAIVDLSKPVIARVHGVATAAGAQLVASADLAFAAEDARFATPGVNIGLFCSTPMVALSRNVGQKQAMQMLLSGDLIDAATALRFGLVNEIVPAAELEARTLEFAQKIASKSPLTLAIGKKAFYRQAELPLWRGLRLHARSHGRKPEGAGCPGRHRRLPRQARAGLDGDVTSAVSRTLAAAALVWRVLCCRLTHRLCALMRSP